MNNQKYLNYKIKYLNLKKMKNDNFKKMKGGELFVVPFNIAIEHGNFMIDYSSTIQDLFIKITDIINIPVLDYLIEIDSQKYNYNYSELHHYRTQ